MLTAYKDTLGLWTIGYGHLLDQSKDWTGYTITQSQASILLSSDLVGAYRIAACFPFYADMSNERQAVLVSMAFQLGDKPLHWPHFMIALTDQDYTAASAAGLDSLWFKETPARAKLEMQILETGQFPT